MTQKNTRPSIKHKTGRILHEYPGPSVSAILLLSASIGFPAGYSLVDTSQQPLEHPGNAQQEEVLAVHETRLAELKNMRAEMDFLKAREGLGAQDNRLQELQSAFSDAALGSYIDLYLKGATSDGPALSEENFDRLRRDFKENIADPSDFGFKKTIATGLLDETLAETDLRTGSDLAKFQTAKEMNEKMANGTNQGPPAGFIGFTLSLSLGILLLIGAIKAENWRDLPARVPRRKPKKSFKH
ncbi:MAG: hypothetical protein EA357_06365 [Micavibrio sp.]|nr:MAG: hypothetical protein EA357_06365 [Micavibrio sp.]